MLLAEVVPVHLFFAVQVLTCTAVLQQDRRASLIPSSTQTEMLKAIILCLKLQSSEYFHAAVQVNL